MLKTSTHTKAHSGSNLIRSYIVEIGLEIAVAVAIGVSHWSKSRTHIHSHTQTRVYIKALSVAMERLYTANVKRVINF